MPTAAVHGDDGPRAHPPPRSDHARTASGNPVKIPHRPVKEREVEALEHVELTGVFAAPAWLRDLGFAAWLLAGITIVVVGAVWIADLTSTIFVPVVVASVLAAVLSPVVRALERRRVPRLAGTAIVFLGAIAAG